nr:hypothetical protein [Jiangella alba]
MDERPPNPPVPVAERVDGLELGVCECGLDQRRMVVAGRVADEVVQEILDLFGCVAASSQGGFGLDEPARPGMQSFDPR